jgi:hypothetical protein
LRRGPHGPGNRKHRAQRDRLIDLTGADGHQPQSRLGTSVGQAADGAAYGHSSALSRRLTTSPRVRSDVHGAVPGGHALRAAGALRHFVHLWHSGHSGQLHSDHTRTGRPRAMRSSAAGPASWGREHAALISGVQSEPGAGPPSAACGVTVVVNNLGSWRDSRCGCCPVSASRDPGGASTGPTAMCLSGVPQCHSHQDRSRAALAGCPG